MKMYYTLVQDFTPNGDKDLGLYLLNQDIEYEVGADFAEELRSRGFTGAASNRLLRKYTVLIEEHELTAIMLSVTGVAMIRNDKTHSVLNFVRKIIKWVLRK